MGYLVTMKRAPKMQFIEMEEFTKVAEKVWETQEMVDLQLSLDADPRQGDLLENTGGFRKMRWGIKRQGKGKRGGARVIYYYYSKADEILLAKAYPKNRKSALSPKDERELRAISAAMRGE